MPMLPHSKHAREDGGDDARDKVENEHDDEEAHNHHLNVYLFLGNDVIAVRPSAFSSPHQLESTGDALAYSSSLLPLKS